MFPGGDNAGASLPTPGGGSPGPGGGYPVDPPAEADPQAQITALRVATIVQAVRQLGMMYPAANPELRQITELMTQVQQKILNAQPAQQPAAPPV